MDSYSWRNWNPSITIVRNIGAYLDSSLNMKQHMNNIIKSCYHQVRSLSKIGSSKKLLHAFVSSRLDNLNSLLIELPDIQLKRLQTIQNHAAHLILQQKKSCHITPLLMELHWLPIKCRIKCELLLLIYKCLHDKAPPYLSALPSHTPHPEPFVQPPSTSWLSHQWGRSMARGHLLLLDHACGMPSPSTSVKVKQWLVLKLY